MGHPVDMINLRMLQGCSSHLLHRWPFSWETRRRGHQGSSMGVWHVNITAWYNIIAVRMIECLTHVTKPTLILLGNWNCCYLMLSQKLVRHLIFKTSKCDSQNLKWHSPKRSPIGPARFRHPKTKHPMICCSHHCLRGYAPFSRRLFHGGARAGGCWHTAQETNGILPLLEGRFLCRLSLELHRSRFKMETVDKATINYKFNRSCITLWPSTSQSYSIIVTTYHFQKLTDSSGVARYK